MADKELTVFVVDLAAPICLFTYLFHTFAAKLIKGLKTDLVSVVLFHSKMTQHNAASGKFKGINVLMNNEQPSYCQLQRLHQELTSEDDCFDLDDDNSDFAQSVLFSTTLLAPTIGRVYTRNIVLITYADSPLHQDSQSKIDSIPKFLQSMPVNMYAIVSGLLNRNVMELRLMETHFAKFQLFSDVEAENIIMFHPLLRKTRPVSVFKGDLRLGADFARVLHDPSYVPEEDGSCLTFKIDVYPAAKAEPASAGTHEYIVDRWSVVKLERKTKHFVWKKIFQGDKLEDKDDFEENDMQFGKVPVDLALLTPGFKFSNFDLIALDNDLKQAATLKLSAAFDILGFLDVDSIPVAYLTGEALFVVPEKDSTVRNLVNHNAFCISLIEEKKAVLTRFVRKAEKEIEVGVLFPVQIKDKGLQAHSLIFIRFPFKEDVKVGNFIKLSGGGDAEEKDNGAPDFNALNKLMEEFIEAKTLPEKEVMLTQNQTIENQKVTMKSTDSSKLSVQSSFKSNNEFYAFDPGANKFSVNVRKLLLKSLEFSDMADFNNDLARMEKSLFGSKETNLFNLENVLTVNTSLKDPKILFKLAQESLSVSKRLAEEIGTGYVRKEDVKKQKQIKNEHYESKGNYGAEENRYDAVPDFGL